MNRTTTISTLPLLACAALLGAAPAQDGAREQAVTRQLDALRPKPATPDAQRRGDDAVARLVRVLDEGTMNGDDKQLGTPAYAWTQLQALGPLAFDTVYRLLPELGPFGTKNALRLLAQRPDDRFTRLLEQMVQSTDPARQVAAAELIDMAPPDARRRLADAALASTVPVVRAQGLWHAAETGAPAAALQADLLALLGSGDRDARGVLTSVLATPTFRGEPGRHVLEALAKAGNVDVFAQVAVRWVRSLAVDQHGELETLLQNIPPQHAYREPIAAGLLQRESVEPMLADVLVDLPVPDQVARALQRLTAARLQVSAAALDALRANQNNAVRQELATYLRTVPLDASHAPALEAGAFDPRLPDDLRSASLQALEQAAPDRFAARLEDVIEDQSLSYVAADLIARHLTPRLVPLAIERMLRTGTSWSTALVDAIVNKSDASDLQAILDLFLPVPPQGSPIHARIAVRALERWVTDQKIPDLVRRWWDNEAMEQLRPLVSRVATPAAAPALVELYYQARHRATNETMANGGSATSFTGGTQQWLARFLPTLDGAPLRAALTAHLADADAYDRADALAHLLQLRGVDRATLARSVLSQPWSAATANILGYMPEVARDEELRQRFADSVLATETPRIDGEGAWHTFLEQTPVEARRRIALALLDAHAQKPRDADLVCGTVRALGSERNPADAERLRALVSDPQFNIRIAAVEQLARLSDPAAVPGLLEALKDDSDDVRAAAKAGLQRLDEYLATKEHWAQRTGK